MSSPSNLPISSPIWEADDERSSPASQADDDNSPPSVEASASALLNQSQNASVSPALGASAPRNISPPPVLRNALDNYDWRQSIDEILQPLLDSSTSESTIIEDLRAVNNTFSLNRFKLRLRRSLLELYQGFREAVYITCYKLLLMPGLIRVACHYFFSRKVRRSIKYGQHSRHRLDIYLPRNGDGPKPVVAFVTGYKSWGSLLAQQLQEQDILVASIDYRNIPQSTLNDMVEDASHGISYVFTHIGEYGGDPNRVYVMGQQIGAYLAACAILHQAIEEAADLENVTWRVSQLRRFFGLSGGYDLLQLIPIFYSRGLSRLIELCQNEGEDSAIRFSPSSLVLNSNARHGVAILPAISLFHGTGDDSICSESSTSFLDNLQSAGVNADIKLYDGKTDADLFLLDPMRGGRDDLSQDLISIIHMEDGNALANYARAPSRPRLVPECMLNLARKIDPLYPL